MFFIHIYYLPNQWTSTEYHFYREGCDLSQTLLLFHPGLGPAMAELKIQSWCRSGLKIVAFLFDIEYNDSRILKRHNLFTKRWPFTLDLICCGHFRPNVNLNKIYIYIDNRSRLGMVVKRLLV